MRLVVVALLCGVRIAAADDYPVELVDRPVVLPDGATALDVSWDFRTYVQNGMRTGVTDNTDPDLSISHAIGPVWAGIGVAHDGYAWVDVDLGGPALLFGGTFSAPQPDDSYRYSQHAAVIYKGMIVPGTLAAYGSATAYLAELGGPPMQPSGHVISIDPRAGLELQIDPHWALTLASELFVPVQHSSALSERVALEVTAQALFAIRRWDFYLGGSLYDVTRSGPSTFVSLGFTKRWGI
jgi:hypothetical protein